MAMDSSSSKSRLVDNLAASYDKLNQKVERFATLSKSAASFIGAVGGGGSRSGGSGSSMDLPSPNKSGFMPVPGERGYTPTTQTDRGFVNPPNQGSMGFGQMLKTGAGYAAAGASMRILGSINSDDYMYNDILTRRFGFFAGQPGRTAGGDNANQMMRAGTGLDPMDAINAQAAGASLGLMPGMQKYNSGVFNSVTGLSNLTGQGLEASMGATAALQQGSSVNKLRMIGVQVRNDQGLPRSFQEIARDLWNHISRTKTGAGKITTEDLDLSMLPGNSLDMLLNQYFGTDAVLRQGVVAALYQMAQGGDFSKKSLTQTGATTAGVQSIANRNASIYAGKNQMTDAGVIGTIVANDTVTNMNNFIQDIRDNFKPFFDSIVSFTTAVNVFSGAGIGGENSPMSAALSMFAYSGKGMGGDDVPLGGGAASPLGGALSVTSEFNTIRNLKIGGKSITTSPHRGIDFRAGTGSAIYAVNGGKVVANGKNAQLGNYVTIQHDDGFRTTYAHMNSKSTANGYVDAGEVIGKVGQTGMADGPHLHLAVQDRFGKYYNPREYLSGSLTKSSDGTQNSDDNELTGAMATKSLFAKSTSSLFGKFAKNAGGGDSPEITSGGTSYGGVTVHINLPSGSAVNERALAQEIKRVLRDEEQLKRMVTR